MSLKLNSSGSGNLRCSWTSGNVVSLNWAGGENILRERFFCSSSIKWFYTHAYLYWPYCVS